MLKSQYISKLIQIGYSLEEAEYVVNSTAWSMVQLEDTVRCNKKLYDLCGNTLDGEHVTNRFGEKIGLAVMSLEGISQYNKDLWL